MGGLLDSTNVVNPLVSVITSIGLDHTQFLGETIEEITTHKAGVIKVKKPVVVGQMLSTSIDMIKEVAKKQSADLKIYGIDFAIEKNTNETFKGLATFKWQERKMRGPHQQVNLAVAIEALLCAGIQLDEEKLAEAVKMTQYPNRFEEIHPNIFLDGAHNPAAAKALRQTIEMEFPGEKVDFVIGMLKRKDLKGTLDELIPVAKSFTFLTFNHPEAATGEELMDCCEFKNKRVTNCHSSSIILNRDEQSRIIVTGSLYLLASKTFQVEA